jgi:hypothetical protein
MRRGSRKARKGQAEVIAAMILIPLLIVVFSTITLSMFKTSVTGTSSFASRAKFEQERSSEALQAVWADTACRIINVGPVDVTIVRVWWVNGTYKAANELIKKGGDITKVSLSEGSNPVPVNAIDYAVTSRGRIFPFKTMCEQSQSTTNQNINVYGGVPFTSEEILNMTRLVGTSYADKKIITGVTKDGAPFIPNVSVLYWADYPEKDWYLNSGSGWVKDIDAYATIDPKALDPDLDNNGINEVTIVSVTSGGLKLTPISLSGKSDGSGSSINYMVNITFVNLLRTRDYVDVITVYFKLVAYLSTNPTKQIAVGTAAILQRGVNSAFASGTVAVGSYAAPGSSGGSIFTVTGSIIFPVKAYDPYRAVIVENEDYNLTLSFTINIPSGSANLDNLRIEYVAVTGAELKWKP